MAFGVRNGMGVEVRKALRQKWALKLGLLNVFHSCDTHDCDSHGNRGGGGEGGAPGWMTEGQKRIYNKLKGAVQADMLRQAEAQYKKDHGKAPPKAKAPRKTAAKKPAAAAAQFSSPELVEQRRKYIEDKKKWGYFPDEVGDLMGKDVQVMHSEIRAEHWLTKSQFMKLRGRNRNGKEMSALDRVAESDNHGLVVERGGRFLNPFGSPHGPGHVAYRLEQFDMAGEMLDKGGLASRIRGEPAFSVELKTGNMPNGQPRAKNRLYLMSGSGSGGRAVALNVVVEGSHVKAALVEWADGTFADIGSVRRSLAKGGKPMTNNLIAVKDFK